MTRIAILAQILGGPDPAPGGPDTLPEAPKPRYADDPSPNPGGPDPPLADQILLTNSDQGNYKVLQEHKQDIFIIIGTE